MRNFKVLILIHSLLIYSILIAPTVNAEEYKFPAQNSVDAVFVSLQDANDDSDDAKKEPNEDKNKEEKPEEKKPTRLSGTRLARAELLAKVDTFTQRRIVNMWGDFFDGIPQSFEFGDALDFPESWNIGTAVVPGTEFAIPQLGGLSTRRVKLAENSSPIPSDRWLFNYNHFSNVTELGDIDRYTFGFEKTFDEGLKSLEVRFPFAHTLSSDQTLTTNEVDPPVISRRFRTEPGNLTLTYKSVIRGFDDGLMTAGLGIGLPTANDLRLFNDDSQVLLQVENNSASLMPYIGFVKTPNDRLVLQGIVQADFATQANKISSAGADISDGLLPAGTIERIPHLYFDLALAYRLTDADNKAITQITVFTELHYSLGMRDSETLNLFETGPLASADSQAFRLQDSERIGALNLTAGAVFQINETMSIRPAVSVPLNENVGNMYDYEFGVQLNILR